MTLVISDLSRTFSSENAETIEALSHISLSVNNEEFICILGPSGCGKTTLLRIVAGLESASSGSVSVDGMPVTRPSPKMAMIFQEYSLYPWRTVEENVMLGLELRGMNKPDRMTAAEKYLDLVGLKGFEKSTPTSSPGG